jgi:hypothetical protein
MELWELLQLSRPEIEKMREEVKLASAQLDNARQKLMGAKVTFHYPNVDMLIDLEKNLRGFKGADIHPQNLPDNLVFFLWLVFGSLVEGESRFNYTEHRDERLHLVGNVIMRAEFPQDKPILERVCDYYQLLLIEADKRDFYIPAS